MKRIKLFCLFQYLSFKLDPQSLHLYCIPSIAYSLHFQFITVLIPQSVPQEIDDVKCVDYCGMKSNGEKVLGIAKFDPLTNTITPDPILSWPVPHQWSMEDATTVPVAYALVCTVFCMLQVILLYVNIGVFWRGQGNASYTWGKPSSIKLTRLKPPSSPKLDWNCLENYFIYDHSIKRQ
jgi:hypothetical protein